MTQFGTADGYLREQYSTADRLRARIDVHERYSERKIAFYAEPLNQLALAPGLTLLDAGCGPGGYLPILAGRGVDVVAMDLSPGMVRESRHRAAELQLSARIVQADIQALPFPDASFDRAMANHMLYHVPDIGAALRELRRVLKPGGRVVLTTNAADHMERLWVLHHEAAQELGYIPIRRVVGNFTLDHLDLVRTVFPNTEVHHIPNAFVFPSPEPALQHYLSGSVDALADRPPDNSHRPKLAALVEAKIQTILQREGVFRVPKDAGCFVATISSIA
jgi:ubiquinone/menaquinone biosynthesis C-methylase UbiE